MKLNIFNITCKLMLAALLLVTARTGSAALTGSKHDFSTSGWNPDGKVCAVCHTPHNSDTTVSVAPLWSHAQSTATSFQMYGTNSLGVQTSTSMKATGLTLNGSSKLCLSCHDGTVALDSFRGNSVTVSTGTKISTANNIGSDLSDDHPIGFMYANSLPNPTLRDVSSPANIGSSPSKAGTIATNLLFGGSMECSSCHDVHNTFTVGSTGMLKMAAANSALCVTCHNK